MFHNSSFPLSKEYMKYFSGQLISGLNGINKDRPEKKVFLKKILKKAHLEENKTRENTH